MTKREKLLEKLMEGQHDAAFSFDEIEQLLLREGFLLREGKGSHRGYRHPDGRKMVLPFHGKTVKPAYVRQIRTLLNR